MPHLLEVARVDLVQTAHHPPHPGNRGQRALQRLGLSVHLKVDAVRTAEDPLGEGIHGALQHNASLVEEANPAAHRSAYNPGEAGSYPPCRFTASGLREGSLPSTRTCPAVGSVRPSSMRMVVVFPEPLGPSSP